MNGATMSLQSAGLIAGPPIAMVAVGFTDWQVLTVLAIAFVVSIWRVMDADPPLPQRKAIASVLTGLVLTVGLSPVLGEHIASKLGMSVANSTIVCTAFIAIGWTRIYKIVETDIVDVFLKVIVRVFKAIFGVKE